MSIPPPHGITETEYETIEAAVTETVRGRWFLNEFARRNRLAETRLLLDAMARLEATVAASQAALPSADPSIRLLIQRVKEVAGQLDGVARAMRDEGVDDRHWTAVDQQARAVAGLMRSATPGRPAPPPIEAPPVKLPRADLPPSLAPRPEAAPAPPETGRDLVARDLAAKNAIPEPIDPPPTVPPSAPGEDPRLALLSGLDGLTLAKKLALFS